MPGTRSKPAAVVGDSGRSALLERLASTGGAALYDARGKRIGMFIEVVAGGSDVAIRHEGALVWRRRVLPLATVAAVLPEHGARGAVVLNVDAETIDRADDTGGVPEDRLPSTDEDRVSQQELTGRLAPYVTARDSHAEVGPPRSSRKVLAQHLLFVPTAQGYQLLEQDGDTPATFTEVSLPGLENAFRVIKVAPSPLPADRRQCAYLERR